MARTAILIVEDEAIVARDIEQQLQALGYDPVAIADTGKEAIELASTRRPDLVLMDIQLSGPMDGIDAATAIRAQFAIPSVFLTAYATDDVVERAKRAEPLGYIIKPFDEYGLRTTIEIALHKDRIDKELRKSEARYRAVVQSAYDAIVTSDSGGERIVGWSPSAATLFGYAEAEIMGQPLTLLMPALTQERRRAAARRTASKDVSVPPRRVRQMEGRRKDGSEFPLELSLAQWETAEGSFVTGMIRDVTERMRSESVARLQSAALNAAANAMVITDRSGKIEWINPAFTTLTGYAADEAIGRNPSELLKSGAHEHGFYEQMWKTLLAGGVWQGELINRRKDATQYVEEQTITPVTDPDGEITHFIAVGRDLTEQKRLQEQFLHSQRMEVVGRLAGGIAHDFNNLLTVINGTADLALLDLPADNPLRTEFEHIQQAGERAVLLTRQLLSFSRKQVLAPVVLNLSDLVAEMSKMLLRLIEEDIDLVIDAPPQLDSVLLDPGQVEQVVLNLVVNARDAMPTGGRLTIETRNVTLDDTLAAAHPGMSPGRHVMLAVTDTGVGMTAEIRDRAFEPFFTTKVREEGTGLGLALVRGIVEQSGGSVLLESEPGSGTCIRMYFPFIAAAAQRGRVALAAAPVRGTETILVVEDERHMRELTTRMLRSAGYHVLSASSGNDALAVLQRHGGPVDLVVTDVVMPGMSGPDLASGFAAAHPDTRVILTSGHADAALLRHGVVTGATSFLAKPYSVTELTRKVRQVLEMPRTRR